MEENSTNFEQCSQNPDPDDDFQASQELLDDSEIQQEKINKSNTQVSTKSENKTNVGKN